MVLAGSRVSNEGLIKADLGRVVLAGANAFAVDFDGDNLLRFSITEPVSQTPKGADDQPAAALVSNSGKIAAAGGKVLLTARAARQVVNNVINTSGIVEATSVSLQNGEIVLDAGPMGTAIAGGTLDASGKGQDATGGTIAVTGRTVEISDGARLDVSGDRGGGTALIGGDLHGGGALQRAETTTVAGDARIAADATGSGNGGKVVVWSDGQTTFDGAISATGAPGGGDGGRVETSGASLQVAAAARVNTAAPKGATGDWLLDPLNINVVTGGAKQLTGGFLSLGTDPGLTDSVAPATIVTALATTNVQLEASNRIQVTNPVLYNSSNSLSLLAKGAISFGASVQNAGTGAITAVAGWDGVTAPANVLTTPGAYGQGLVSNSFISVVGTAAVGTAIGSAGGTTTLLASTVQLQGSGAAGFVQIGNRASGSTGAIVVRATSSAAPVADTSTGHTGIPSCAVPTGGNLCLISGTTAGAYAQIGHLGRSGPGSAAGAIDVDVTGHIVLLGGGLSGGANPVTQVPGSAANDYAQIGHGDSSLTAANIDALTGDINVHALGTIFLDNSTVSTSLAWIGNRTSSSSRSGNVSIIAADIKGSTGNTGITDIKPIIAYDIGSPTEAGGDFTLGYTGLNAPHFGGLLSYSSPHALTLLSAGDIFFEGNVQGSGSGAITVIGGWNANVAPADVLTTPGAYGLNNGTVTIGGAGAAANAIVQSASGTMTVASANLSLNAVNGFAQLGWHQSNGSGSAVVSVTGDLNLAGGGSAGSYALIGNGDASGLLPGFSNESGDIGIGVAGTTRFRRKRGRVVDRKSPRHRLARHRFRQCDCAHGNLAAGSAASSDTNNILTDIVAADIRGGDFTFGLTNSGQGLSVDRLLSYSSPHALSITTPGDLVFAASVQNSGSGNLSFSAGGNVTIGGSTAPGAVAVGSASGTTALDGANLFLQAVNGYSQLGFHGAGSGALAADSSAALSLTAGNGSGFFAQIGHGGFSTDGSHAGAIGIVAGGDMTLTGGAASDAYVQIGHGGSKTNTSSNGYSNTGAISVAGNNISLTAGPGISSYAQLGNGGYQAGASLLAGSGDNGGDIGVIAANAVVLSGGGEGAYAQIGNGGGLVNTNAAADAHGVNSGNILVSASASVGHAVILTAGPGLGAYAQIGNGGYSTNAPGNASAANFLNTGDVHVSDLLLVGGNGEANAYSQIGNGDASRNAIANVSGNIVIDNNGTIVTTRGTAVHSPAFIGNATGLGSVAGELSGYAQPPIGEDARTDGLLASLVAPSPTAVASGGDAVVPLNPGIDNAVSLALSSMMPMSALAMVLTASPIAELAGTDAEVADAGLDSHASSDGISGSVGKSLDGTPGSHPSRSLTLVGGLLTQIVPVAGFTDPHGVPPADQDFSSWGNKAYWQW